MTSLVNVQYNPHNFNGFVRSCYYWTTLCYLASLLFNLVKSGQLPSLPQQGLPHPSNNNRNGNTRLDKSAELVLGTFSQEQDNAWFYETYYPIILKLPMPDWSSGSHRLNRSAPKCDSKESLSNFACPSQQYLDILLTRLSQNIRYFKNIFTASLFPTEKDDRFHEDNLHCMKIKPHFYHFSTTVKGMESYLENIRQKCPLAKNLQMIDTIISSADMAQAKVRTAYERFTTKYNVNKPNFDKNGKSFSNGTVTDDFIKTEKMEWDFVQMSAFTTFQNTFNLFNYGDYLRWSNAFTTCQSYRLDVNLIPPRMLINILNEASSNLTRLGLGYNISIPVDRLLTHFYKLPLTDCILAMDMENAVISNAFLVLRLLVPVTRTFKTYKVMKLNKVPFFIRNTQNGNVKKVGNICQIKNYEYEETFLVEYHTFEGGTSQPLITSVMKAPPSCGPYNLCRIPDTVHRNLVNLCVEGIISRNGDMTKEECGFRCFPVSKKQIEDEFPFAIQLTSNRFAIVGVELVNETSSGAIRKVSIMCSDKIKVDRVKQENNDEATIITLPCTCHISIGNYKYFPEYPCGINLEIIHVTHVINNGYNGFKLFEDAEKTINIQNVMNGKKGNKSRTARSGNQKKKMVSSDELVKVGATEEAMTEFSIDDTLLHIFSTSYAINSRFKGEVGPPRVNLEVINASEGDEHACTHGIVWVLGFILLISDIAILYELYNNGYVSLDGVLFMN